MSEEKEVVCDVCKHPDHLAGVASSSLGPMSKMYCGICLGMGAEEEWMIDFVFEENNFRAQCGKESFIFFDKKLDSYVNYGTREVIPIVMKDKSEFLTRKETVEYVESNSNKVS